ncbi:MAG: glycosyltransferase [Anaerolineales bacterium]
MKIACIASSAIPSATANSIQVMKVCQALQQVGGAVRLWVPGKYFTDWVQLADFYGLTTSFEIEWVRASRFWKRYDLAWKSVELAQRWGADMIYTWMMQSAVLALWRGLPVILELHDRPSGRVGPWLFREFIRHPGRKRLLVITEALLERVQQEYHMQLPQEWVQIAPNGTELERYENLPQPEEARRQLGLPQMPTVVYSGSFYAGRGLDLLLHLARDFPLVMFLWIGGRPQDVAGWKKRLSDMGLRNVHLTGFVENSRLPLYQAAGDVLLMPYERAIAGSSGGNSAEICSPMKMFDYLACGRPILASDLPVFHEVLNDNNAVFCPPQDTALWSKTLEALLADADRRQRLGEQAKADSARYTWRERAGRALADFLINLD